MVNHLNVLSLILILISISAKKLLDWHSCEGDILSIDTAALTGEPLPRKYPSEECLSCRGVKFEDRERMRGWEDECDGRREMQSTVIVYLNQE